MPYTVIVQLAARVEIAKNAAYLQRHFGFAKADRWRKSVERRMEVLATDPQRWPEAEESGHIEIPLRVLYHGRGPHVFRILFTIFGDSVYVHRVRHAAQDWLGEDDL